MPDGRFWFLEMNTRLQVEHPVTECTTGLDLVELQLLVAAGGRLPPAAPPGRGAAVEARLYAEDPAAGWLPVTGTLLCLDVPVTQPAFTPPVLDVAPRGVRLDAGVEDGAVISVHYDPMLAKVIAWAPTRAEACAVLARALTRARIHGLRTNRDLLVRVLGHPAFAVGDTDTASSTARLTGTAWTFSPLRSPGRPMSGWPRWPRSWRMPRGGGRPPPCWPPCRAAGATCRSARSGAC